MELLSTTLRSLLAAASLLFKCAGDADANGDTEALLLGTRVDGVAIKGTDLVKIFLK